MSDSSSSEDDLPLSALGNKKAESSDEAEFDEEEEEDDAVGEEEEPDTDEFIVEDSEDDGDGDEDYASESSDDVPLTALKSKKAPAPKKPKAKPAKKAAPKKKATPKKKKAATKKKGKKSASSSSKGKKPTSSSAINYVCPSGELYANCDKGKLVQSLLARWWYAYEWPDPKCFEGPTPDAYDALDGFPGLYICTRGCDVGKILDRRDHAKSPSFRNFAKKSSEELKGLLLAAIEKQRAALIEHEGKGTETEKQLGVLEKWASKLNCDKADRQADKVLKAKKLTLS
ncbi:hypothetical protein ACHAWF_010303 [Thalassiosira exigua]